MKSILLQLAVRVQKESIDTNGRINRRAPELYRCRYTPGSAARASTMPELCRRRPSIYGLPARDPLPHTVQGAKSLTALSDAPRAGSLGPIPSPDNADSHTDPDASPHQP